MQTQRNIATISGKVRRTGNLLYAVNGTFVVFSLGFVHFWFYFFLSKNKGIQVIRGHRKNQCNIQGSFFLANVAFS